MCMFVCTQDVEITAAETATHEAQVKAKTEEATAEEEKAMERAAAATVAAERGREEEARRQREQEVQEQELPAAATTGRDKETEDGHQALPEETITQEEEAPADALTKANRNEEASAAANAAAAAGLGPAAEASTASTGKAVWEVHVPAAPSEVQPGSAAGGLEGATSQVLDVTGQVGFGGVKAPGAAIGGFGVASAGFVGGGRGGFGGGGAVLVVVWLEGVSVEDLVGVEGVEGALGLADLVRAERPGN